MENFKKAISVLEFDKILGMLAECASLEGAKNVISGIMPDTDVAVIKKLQNQTSDAKAMMVTKGTPSFMGVKPVENSVARAEKSAVLTVKELLNIEALLGAVRNLRTYSNDMSSESSLYDFFNVLVPNNALEDKIKKTFMNEEQIADDASEKLHEIRIKIRRSHNKVRENMQKYITGTAYSKYLQENIITTRGGRFVIPVKAEARNEIKGLVHDTSASGATLFIEPLSVVELNNEIKVLENEEKHEVERILYELSADCAAFSEGIRLNYSMLVEICVIFARAELSYRLDCVSPIISDKKTVDFIHARHPLLDKKKVVPIDVKLGGTFSSLIITGPNTGGKTVTLKTLGLLSMMVQCGLHIPCSEGSKACVFDNILADIGDEQSIEQSLSTFSSHMKNIVSMLDEATENTLVLFDELGAGTDPVEGAALATAILDGIRQKGILCAATTHYAELKAYAINTDGVENASCEFDVDTLKPTYKLVIGTPGKSNAFLISLKLGLSEDIINTAKEYISSENRQFEGTIENLEKKRFEMEALRAEAQRMRDEIKRTHDETVAERDKLLNAAQKEVDRARAEANRILKSAKATSDYVLDELDAIKKKREEERYNEEYDKAKEEMRRRIRTSEKDVDNVSVEHEEEYELPRELREGDKVIIAGVNREGTVIAVSGDDVQVLSGSVKMKVPKKNLRLVTGIDTSKTKKQVKKTSGMMGQRSEIRSEIDLRGQIGDDAWFLVDKYIDDLQMAGLHSATLIHGKGTGALRAALWRYLKNDKRILSYRMGMYGEGDSGVTVIEIK
ncbi:MAG: endonuclease MutS2 [Ruminococcaceae bacterium]|nr:endonuclease MutS2 [Oscillospiraceae bacterium]